MTDRIVGLLWHSMNSDNLGVGALTVAHMAIVRAAARRAGDRVRFKVLGWADPKSPYFESEDIDQAGFRLADFARVENGFLGAARQCDVVLDIGAGDSFSDIYGPSRILKMIAGQNLVRLAGRPLVISPQTIGPFANPAIRLAALGVLKSAAFVSTRDEASAAYASSMGFNREVLVASDVALRLPFEAPGRRAGGPVRVGINVSGLLWNGGYSRDNMFALKSDHQDLVRRIARLLQGKPDVELHLVSHVLSDDQPLEDDRRAASALAADVPGAVIAPDFKTPSEAKSYIAGLDFFVGARMHACIAAFSSGVPVVALAYSRKFEGLFGALGYAHVADCRTETAETILERIDAAYDARETLRREAAAATDRGLVRLFRYEEALVEMFARLPAAKAAA